MDRALGLDEPLYRLITSLLDPESAPAAELAALYHERWEQEGAFAELEQLCRNTPDATLAALHRFLGRP